MSHIVDNTSTDVAGAVISARRQRGWTGAQLATAAGVSRAMVDRVERGVSSPTASLLGRLSGALGLTMSALLARGTRPDQGVVRDAERSEWIDPETGYRRRQVVSAPTFPIDVTEVGLPAGATVAYPAAAFTFTRHAIWVLEGTLTFHEGASARELHAGDRLVLGEPTDCEYANLSGAECRYAVIVVPV